MFSYSQWLDELIKAAGHKYIKRIPYQSGGKMRYRYIYNVTHTHQGKHVLDPAHMKVGTKLMLDATSGAEVHGHIQSVSGDKVTFIYDDGPKKGESVTMTKQQMLRQFDETHNAGQKIDVAREALRENVQKMRQNGVGEKQIARVQARIARLTREIKQATQQGKLHRSLLEKYKVSPAQVKEAIEEWSKTKATTEDNPDVMMWRRLQRVERDGSDVACEMYNNLIERSAQENQAVLKAVEAYHEILGAPYTDAQSLNMLAEAKEGNRDVVSAGVHWTNLDRFFSRKYEDMKGFRGHKRDLKNIQALTGIDLKDNPNMTIGEALEHIAPTHTVYKKIQDVRAKSSLSAVALYVVVKEVTNTCDEFSFRHNTFKKGDVHPLHTLSVDGLKPFQEEAVRTDSENLAFVESIFQRAYPERAAHRTSIAYTREERSSADCRADESTLFISKYADLRTRAHELAHTLEGRSNKQTANFFARPTVADRNANTYPLTNRLDAQYQTAIQQAVTLTHMSRIERGTHEHYNNKERTFADNYTSRYAGKLYNEGSSELVSTSVEAFFKSSDPKKQMRDIANFAVSDPHTFLLIYGILKGYAK